MQTFSSCCPARSRSRRSSKLAPSATAAIVVTTVTDAGGATTSETAAVVRVVVTVAARDGDGGGKGRSDQRRQRPHFEAPPELPQRPKPKRLRPGKARRNAVLADLPEEQRPIAEMALQGMSAVHARVKEENTRLEAAGQPTMPEASVVKMAEDMLPKLRVAEWLDRAEAAQRQMEHLDLRDLRSVVAAGDDPIVARDSRHVPLPTTCAHHSFASRKKNSRCGSVTSMPPSASVVSFAPCVCRRSRPRPA